MRFKSQILASLSLKLMRRPEERTTDYSVYDDWRHESLQSSWDAFDDRWITDRDVLDFGCGDGQMSLYLVNKNPRSMTGVDLSPDAIARASQNTGPLLSFILGSATRIPSADDSIDTLLAFDCMEHVMRPGEILREWNRVLRPGGRCLIEWFPFKGPWGPHMESLIPVPWAHYLFGEEAMFEAAAEIYDNPGFVPRHWDLDEKGDKKPNKWRQWSTFAEQGYVNELDITTLEDLATRTGFRLARLERRSFAGPTWRRALGKTLMKIVGDPFVMSAIIELEKLEGSESL